MVSYTPKHSHPVTQQELNRLEPELLTAEISRLQHSIQHLERSNRELDDFAREDQLDDDDRKEFTDSIDENEQTMIRLALSSKLGVDAANAHYDLATATPVPSLPPPAGLPPPAAPVARPATGGPRWADDDPMEGGEVTGVTGGATGGEQGRGAGGGGTGGGEEEADGGVYL